MRRRLSLLGAALGVAAACSSDGASAVPPDAIDAQEKAAVQAALNDALADDTLYPTLAALVFPFIDRASRLAEANGDTTRIVGVQLDIDATQGGMPTIAKLSAILAWRGYDAGTRTVDTVVFVLGEGLEPPVDDSLRTSFSTDTAGTGTGFVIHQVDDATYRAWLARTGAMHVTGNSYGRGESTSAGDITLTLFRGTLLGDYHMTAKLVPDSLPPDVGSAHDFAGGIQAVRINIRGSLP